MSLDDNSPDNGPEKDGEALDLNRGSEALTDPCVARRVHQFVETAQPVGKHRSLSEWSGARLWNGTYIEPLSSANIDGDSGVEGVYQRSLIPVEMITALQEGTYVRCQQEARASGKYRGGMLNEFRTPPLLRSNPEMQVHSVCEQIHRDIDATLSTRGKERMTPENRVRAMYEGSVLVPSEGEQRVLAWATWTRSRLTRIQSRTPERDQHVAQLLQVLKSLRFSMGVNRQGLESEASRTILFDTLNADPGIPGAASLLFDHLCDQWIEQGYTRILLYRHSMLQMVDITEQGKKKGCAVAGLAVPQGNNDASQDFFGRRGFGDIGTRYSSCLAPRDWKKGEKLYPGYVLSTEGWMAADLKHTASLSHDINTEAQRKYGGISVQ